MFLFLVLLDYFTNCANSSQTLGVWIGPNRPSVRSESLGFNLVPRDFSSFKMAVGETLVKAAKPLQKFLRILSRETRWNVFFVFEQSFRLQENKKGCQTLETTSEKQFHHVSRDKILHDSWSISAALARGFSDGHFEWGEGPGEEVGLGLAQHARIQNPNSKIKVDLLIPQLTNNPNTSSIYGGLL